MNVFDSFNGIFWRLEPEDDVSIVQTTEDHNLTLVTPEIEQPIQQNELEMEAINANMEKENEVSNQTMYVNHKICISFLMSNKFQYHFSILKFVNIVFVSLRCFFVLILFI